MARFVDNSGENEELIKKAIYWHSAFRIDPQLNDREMLFAKVIRDADKIDILKVATDFPLEEIYNVATEQIHAHLITEEVMQQFRQKQAIFRDTKKVPIDNLVILLWFLNWSFRKAMKLSRNRAIWIDC